MSTLLTAQSLHVDTAFGTLFDGLTFTLKKGDRIGLIGDNGCGKSTLLKVLDGSIAPTSGTLAVANHCHLARVEQHLPDEILPLTLQEAVLAQLPEQDRAGQLWRIEALLAQMGFRPQDLTLTAQTLSGGQHTRLLLARALMRNPDLLLLDEPGNHLDMEGKEALAQTLQIFEGGVLLVSHDRQFIRQSCNRFWFVDEGELSEWHDLDAMNARIRETVVEPLSDDKAATQGVAEQADENALLEKLIALEQRLADDLARKPRHQKPQLQAQWRKEIADIMARL